ncbi:beta-ribofuranosylaminobenzene 5'-phosphate synthase family protein [Fulvimarina sp. 2208YS6-2-32]|uniref:Beta-ribofuranosylaminobenzene 5'-phosphate synthase family protein n=1 Tax=Fulvimarina uroteuthidis TaxID=3098149 RepID=A0ABU5HYC8_9HYPH|nr:beta-ribofuranosylaminobenzene 5'-phosphate synthase family protein [Fulvimarina sp. 2208YS6-2-32]MDY8108097.1 beta-ribofuranosylaminobenzene 5'-phosphate synthase family protein [Fulvimarina sp. 2208YS6-2-32]
MTTGSNVKEDAVHISAPARLHLGFLDPGANFGRRFGGIGLAIDGPATSLSIARHRETSVEGPEAARARSYLESLMAHLGLGEGYRVEIETVIPSHSGLGSGTQLALALSCALRTLEGRPLDVEGDSAILGRGQRSGLGAAFVTRGGLAVDGGKGEEDTPPPLVARFDFPDDWRVILVFETDLAGIHGEAELDAFASLPAFPRDAAGEVSALTLMQVLPGLVERDIKTFGHGLARIQAIVGSHFAPAQGGVFTSRRVARAMDAVKAHGGHGIGQSSWGPTGFAFAPSEASARRIVERATADGALDGLAVRIAKGRNEGARIERGTGAGRHVRVLAGAGSRL